MDPIVLIAVTVLLLILYYAFQPNAATPLPLPPGPKALPIIGNALDIPSSMPWKTFRELSKKYGTSFTVLYICDCIDC